jgi:hypothetical protein
MFNPAGRISRGIYAHFHEQKGAAVSPRLLHRFHIDHQNYALYPRAATSMMAKAAASHTPKAARFAVKRSGKLSIAQFHFALIIYLPRISVLQRYTDETLECSENVQL